MEYYEFYPTQELKIEIPLNEIIVGRTAGGSYIIVESCGSSAVGGNYAKEDIAKVQINFGRKVNITFKNGKSLYYDFDFTPTIMAQTFFKLKEELKETKADLELANAKIAHIEGFFELQQK